MPNSNYPYTNKPAEFGFEFFRLASMIGEMLAQCEDEEKPIEERFPHQMITAFNGKIIDISGYHTHNQIANIDEIWYLFEIRFAGEILHSGKDLTNIELLRAVYDYFRSEK